MSYNPRIEDLERKVKTLPSGGSVPVPSTEDVGKIPVVNADGEYELANAPSGLPSTTSADAGKVLTVNEDGDGVEWEAAQSGGGYDAEFTIYHSNTSSDPYVITRVSGDFATLKAMCDSGDCPFFRVRVNDRFPWVFGATDVVAVYAWDNNCLTLFVHAPLTETAPNNIWKSYTYIQWNSDNTITMD